MTLEALAAALDGIALEMGRQLMPADDDPDRARQAYVLGLATHAVIERARQLRQFAGVAEPPDET